MLAGALGLGCLLPPSRSLCEIEVPLSVPYEGVVFEDRRPESPAPFEGEPRGMTVRPRSFDEDAWALYVLNDLPPRAAPELSADPGPGGSVLVCAFEAGPSAGIDGIDGPTGPL